MIPRTTERPNTIGLQVSGKYDEGRCYAALSPGHLLEIVTTTIDYAGEEKNLQQRPPYVQKNSSAGSPGPVLVALEDRLGNYSGTLGGRTIETAYMPLTGNDSDVAGFYAGDIVPMVQVLPGDIIAVRVATNAKFLIGDLLQAHSDGTVVALDSGTAIFEVAEEIDFSDSDNDDTPLLLRVRAL